ncbi:MAG: DNA-protecting protein DprA [Magnetococcales bacterium]|nr:DNA-protecting protein DprA [Magnetococcales bacterium]
MADETLSVDWLTLLSTPGLGRTSALRLVQYYGTPGAVLQAHPDRWGEVPGVRLGRLRDPKGWNRAWALQELDRLYALGGMMLIWGQPDYPEILNTLFDPPPVLFCLGSPRHLEGELRVALVGARKASDLGMQAAYRISGGLARAGMVAVSGLAVGIDAAAHAGALDAGGVTVAVTAAGLDVNYPARNETLRRVIIERGCVVTEAFFGAPPVRGLFAGRNRIISGLCRGVVVVEAGARSGALITASAALDQNREVFAVPGPGGDPRFRGSNGLLRQGAALVEEAEDILQALSWTQTVLQDEGYDASGVSEKSGDAAALAFGPSAPPEKVVPPVIPVIPKALQALPETAAICAGLASGPLSGDDLARHCGLTVGALSRILLQLEMAGFVERLPGNLFALRQDL